MHGHAFFRSSMILFAALMVLSLQLFQTVAHRVRPGAAGVEQAQVVQRPPLTLAGHSVPEPHLRPAAFGGDAEVTTWAFDPVTGLLLSKTDDSDKAVEYTYTPDGRLKTRQWARSVSGNRVTTTYAYYGEESGQSKTGEMHTVAYSDGTPGLHFEYTRLGRQSQITDSAGTRTFTYNEGAGGKLNLFSEAINPTGGGLYSKTIYRKYQGTGGYEVPGRDGGFYIGPWDTREYDVWYSYDGERGRFNGIGGPGVNAVSYSRVADSDLIGNTVFEQQSYFPRASAGRSYDSNRDLVTSVSNASASGGTFSTYTYAYDSLGRRKSVVNGGTQFSPAELNKWGYNERSELLSSYRHWGDQPDTPGTEIPAERRKYAYDPIGNRQNITVGDSAQPTLRYCADDLNRYNQTYTGNLQTCPVATPAESFVYDDDGNLNQDGTFNYTWDAENRLKTATRS